MKSYGAHVIDKQDVKAVTDALLSDWLTQGPKVKEFEEAIAEGTKTKYAVAVSSGTSALHLAYLAAGIKKGDEVITTPNTFVATTNMLLAVGAKPVFCDTRPDTWNINEKNIESLITPRTKAIVPVHFAGQPCEMDTIKKIAKKHNLIVIEDAAHAIGATYKNKPIGSISEMTTFSFHPVKTITTGEGGIITTNNKEYYNNLLSLRSHGVHKNTDGFNVMTQLGYNYRLTDIQAALGLSQLSKLSSFIKTRAKLANRYHKLLSKIPEIIIPTELPHLTSAWHLYVIRTKDPNNRNPLMKHLTSKGIGVNFHYPAVYSHPYYRKNGYSKTSLAMTDQYHKTAITIPLHPRLSMNDIATISNHIKDFFK